MTAPPLPLQKPADQSPYATLRSSAAADDAQRQSAPASPSNGFTAELAKLQELRDALWEAFKAGPDAGLPTILIELTNSYTNSLRMQLNMKSLHARHPRAPAPISAHANAATKK
jgi:hypothetical protein